MSKTKFEPHYGLVVAIAKAGSQAEVASLAEVTPPYINKLCRLGKPLPKKRAQLLAEKLKMPLNAFI